MLLPCVLMLAGFHTWLSVDGRSEHAPSVVPVASMNRFRTTKEVLTSRSGNDLPSGAHSGS